MRLFVPDRVYAANHVGILWPGRLDLLATMHPDEALRWQQERAAAGRNTDFETVTYLCADRKRGAHINRFHDHIWDGQRNGGSSGFFATKVAFDDGATHIVLAGIPMTQDGGHIIRPGPWDAGSYQETWRLIAHRFCGRVRSMGGWTASLFGKPTPEWLATPPAEPADADRRTGQDCP